MVNEIVVEKLVYGGEGLARADGKVILTPFVLPGERVRVEPVKESGGLVRARLAEIVEPAPERTAAPCALFGKCGGCHYQHAPYPEQLRWKLAILREVFRRVGKMEAPEEIEVVSGPPLEYRNRVQFHLQDGRIGFHRQGSHRLQPVESCPIASPKINEALAALRRMIKQPRFPGFVRSLELFTNGEQVQINILETGGRRVARGFFEWYAKMIPGSDANRIDYPAAGDMFRVGHRSFFQVNRFLVDQFAETVLEDARGKRALDLYAGVGFFSVPLGRRFDEVEAVESGKGAANDLEFNAERAGVRIAAKRNSAEPHLEETQVAPDFILADPPRSGLGRGMVGQLLRLAAPRLTIVSCDPSTLARDLAALMAGGYRLEKLKLVDLFPQTYHIETVCWLRH